MPKKKSEKSEVMPPMEAVIPIEEEATKVEVPKTEPPKPKPAAQPLVSFARWFKARAVERGYKAHWAEGMQAFTDTSKRKTMSDWDETFRNY